jgi:hypothetical protein
MKNLRLFTVAALLSLAVAIPASAARRKASIKVINQSKWEIHELYLSPASSHHWGPDQLEDQVLAKGESLTLTNITCDRYDIKVVDEDGDECVIEDQQLCGEALYWKITDKALLACENED